MSKIIDITDKLSFDENPTLVIKKEKIEVNSDAPTMLKIMALMGDGEPDVQEILKAYEYIFPAESRKKLDKLKLNISDLMTVIQEAVGLVIGDVSTGGAQPHTMTSSATTT